jgi:hypothetical protein
VEPSGPAGASRASVSSSTATQQATATSTLVTEARAKGRSVGPVRATVPAAVVTPAAALVTGQVASASSGPMPRRR